MGNAIELKGRLDKIFSLYIRLRDCPKGYGYCISCGAVVTPKTADCGHFISRIHTATRWDERNCNIQCRECNSLKHGNVPGYTNGLVAKYGNSVIGQLKELSHTIVKMSESDYTHKIKSYTKKTKELL